MSVPVLESGIRDGVPALSLVVASTGDAASLQVCLTSLRTQSAGYAAELVVARACEAPEIDRLVAAHPYARFVACAPGSAVAQLRAAGARAATGDIVALMEDDCVAAADWLEQLVSHYRPAVR